MKEIAIKFLKKKLQKVVEDVIILQDNIVKRQKTLSASLKLVILPSL